MSSQAGPRIHGIGRSGDSNLLLCLDAHDAGSYPGEPTTNYISSVTGWPGSAGVGYATPVTLGEFGQLRNLAPIFDTYGLVPYTLSMEMKGNIPGGVYVYMQNGSYTKYSFVALSVNVTTEYQLFTFSNLTPAGPTAAWLANTPSDDRAMLACYTGYGSGRNPTVRKIQLELGAYATPFVEPRLPDPYAQGYSARPASVNLMMSGNGFEDLSPSKHVITASGGATTGGPGKFSSTSLDFTTSGSSFSIPSSEDFNLGTGDFTFDFWYNPPTVETYNYLLYIGNYNAVFYFYNISTSTGGYSIIHNNPTTWQYAITSGAVGGNNILAANEWQHIAFTRAGNTFRVFRNGILLATDTDSANITKDGAGIAQGAYGGDGINGYVDQYRLTKGTALWTQSFTPPTRRNRSAPIVDLSGNNNGVNLAVKSATGVATYRKGQVIEPIADAIWDFDGTDEYFETGLYLSSTCSISCWYKRTEPDITSSDDIMMNVNCWNNTGSNNFFYMMVQDPYYNPSPGGSVEVWAYGYTSGSRDDWYPSGQPYASYVNVWRNVCVTFDGSSGYAYMDGEYMGSDTLPFTGWKAGDPGYSASGNNQSTLLFAGRRGYGSTAAPTRFFNGEMANCMVFNKTLTAAQVKDNFNAQRSRFGV